MPPHSHRVIVAPVNLRRTRKDRVFSLNHLFLSPPPSPSLPALVPRRKGKAGGRPRRVLRGAVYLLVLGGLWLLSRAWAWGEEPWYAREGEVGDGEGEIGEKGGREKNGWRGGFEMVGQDAVPEFPTPIVTSRGYGGPRWTVSIPLNRDFPLSVEEYEGMGSLCREVAAHAMQLHGRMPNPEGMEADAYYVDVDDAERAGLLPPARKGERAMKTGSFVGLDWELMAGLPVCERSLTYVLESRDAGLGVAVMNLWMLHGVAKRQKRAFFVDDSRWAYGAYEGVFQAPPLPACRPPPRRHMVPCPARAKHLVVSGGTLRDVLPALMAGQRGELRDMFELAKEGYEALFRLTPEDEGYVAARVAELRAKAGGAPIVGMHIRHGDRHPFEYQYRNAYVPPDTFLTAAQRVTNTSTALTIIASDDPATLLQPEFAHTLRSQTRILLYMKKTTPDIAQDPRVLHPFKEEETGWEGGFYAGMFWNLGGADRELGTRLRRYVGRAYMLDLKVLGASDYVVCAVSAMGCRMLAVMMGWEAVEGGRWVNVDGDYGWGWMDEL